MPPNLITHLKTPHNTPYSFIFLKWANIAAFSLDISSTKTAFLLGAVEANPIMHSWSYPQIALAKALVLSFILLLSSPSRTNYIILLYGALSTFSVVLWNLFQLATYIRWIL